MAGKCRGVHGEQHVDLVAQRPAEDLRRDATGVIVQRDEEFIGIVGG